MDSQTRAQRHSQLWEGGCNSVRRIALGGLIFSVLILLKVVAPYEKREVLQQSLLDSQTRVESAASDLARVREVEKTLQEIEAVIRDKPWSAAKNALKEFFRQGQAGDAQARADQAVQEIAQQIRKAIVVPLREATQHTSSDGELAKLPNFVEDEIEKWEYDKLNINTRWYLTVGQKEEAIKEAEAMLVEVREQAGKIIQRTKADIGKSAGKLKDALTKAETELAEISKTIKQGMDDALPAWAGKLISAPGLVILYPWIVIGIALFFVGSALNTSRHFHGMADETGWTADERRDPLLSSIWTLTLRGPLGTTMTLLTYSVVLAGLWYCLYLSQQYTKLEYITALLNQGEEHGNKNAQGFPIWLGHGFMALAIILTYAWIMPRSRRS